MMNDYAAKLGCTGTHFSNPHGLQDENHYTTPYDIYLMLIEAFTYPEFTEITELAVLYSNLYRLRRNRKKHHAYRNRPLSYRRGTAPKMLQFSVVKPEQQK